MMVNRNVAIALYIAGLALIAPVALSMLRGEPLDTWPLAAFGVALIFVGMMKEEHNGMDQ
jgi:hypothetical protein